MNYLVAYLVSDSGMGRYARGLLQLQGVYGKVLGNKKQLLNYRKASDIVAYSFDNNISLFQKMSENDLIHFPYNLVDKNVKKGRVVVTIHDLNPLRVRIFSFRDWIQYLKETRYTIKRADYIITVSENSKRDLISLFKVDPQKIKVIYFGWNTFFGKLPPEHPDRATLIKRYKLPKNIQIVLTQGNKFAHKNIPRTVEAFARLDRKDCVLVIVGNVEEQKHKICRAVKRNHIEDRVIITGRICDDELRAWYNMATVFVFVSLYEGFGLPPLEAMACGTPVITSSTSSLPEVVGNAAIKVNPRQISEIANAMKMVLGSEALRKQMIQRGYKRTEKFFWEKYQKETEEYIQSLTR